MNRKVMKAFGMVRGVSHSEFIRGRDDGQLYFLETSARVGGAHIVDLIETATGINMWAEWAKVEIAGGKAPYQPPPPRKDFAGLLVSLARQEHPDTSAYNDPEIVWRMDEKKHHVGLIVKSPRCEAGAGVAPELRPADAAGFPGIAAAAGEAEFLRAVRTVPSLVSGQARRAMPSRSFWCSFSQPSLELD
jgi:hypothetical protein